MNILFVLYGDFTSSSAIPLALYTEKLSLLGHSCAITVPNNIDSVCQFSNASFRPILYEDVLSDPLSVFEDGNPAQVIHACTPREIVRHFVTSYMAKQPTPLVIFLEDNEPWISKTALGLDETLLNQLTDKEISNRLPSALSHPFYWHSFVGLGDAVAVIQEKLKPYVPPWVPCETVLIGVDLKFFSPRPPIFSLRTKYGVRSNEKVIVYHGGLNGFVKPAIETLCKAVGLINQKGYPCRLLRTGPFPLNFLDQFPPETQSQISDLGVLPRHDLPDLLALADVAVQPGQNDPFDDLRLPGKIPEFLAMGLPLVIPNTGIAYLFKEGENAALFHNGSAEDIAAKCLYLFSNLGHAKEIGQLGQKVAEKYFDVKHQVSRLENLYTKAYKNFHLSHAKVIWQEQEDEPSMLFRLARKLNLLSHSKSIKSDSEVDRLFGEFAKYLQLMNRRVKGVENEFDRSQHEVRELTQLLSKNNEQIANLTQQVGEQNRKLANLDEQVAKRDQHISNLNHQISERDGQLTNFKRRVVETEEQLARNFASKSWRITAPLRYVAHRWRLTHKFFAMFPHLVKESGGLNLIAKKGIEGFWQDGWLGVTNRVRNKIFGTGVISVPENEESTSFFVEKHNYTEWVRRYDTVSEELRVAMRHYCEGMTQTPLISVLMPTYNPGPKWLTKAIESVRAQIYPHWELCISDDASTDRAIRPILERYSKLDPRIKVVYREQNGHISAASNDAFKLAKGEWVALLDHDDLLPEHALFWVAETISRHPDIQLIYSDEDKIDEKDQRFHPYFKCDWNVDLFYSHNLFSHLGVYRSELVQQIGGFRQGFEGSQDYDLALRCIEQISPHQIRHIPRVLYHWRVHDESTAQAASAKPYAMKAGERAINDHFHRQGVKANAELIGTGYRVRYSIPDTPPLVTLIIPTRNGLHHLRQCIDSILKKTSYQNYEILIVDNGSDDPDTLQYLTSLERGPRIRLTRDDRPFNFSALNNSAVQFARGEVLGLLNNDVSVISPEWLNEMVSLAIQPDIGAVGARLWYPNDTLQHGGIFLGTAGLALNSHKGFPQGCHGYFGRMSLISAFSAVTGACLVIQKSIYEAVGGLNETDLPVAYNDVDFCLRVREAGYRNVWTPYADLYHQESATRGSEEGAENQARFAKEAQYMKKRWAKEIEHDPCYSPNLTLHYEDFSFAWPPRVPNWKEPPATSQEENASFSPLSRVDKVMSLIDKNGLGLEIGPSHNPLAPKKQGFNVHVLDLVSAEQLREKFRGFEVNIDNIEEVDFVWRGEPFHELIGKEHEYDWIIASHVIEHTPDLISFLAECERLLTQKGVLSLIIPDKRCCFDFFHATTTTGELLDAYAQKRTRPSPGKVFDHCARAVKCNEQIAWGPEIRGHLDLVHDFTDTVRHWELASTTEEYIDVHNWRFTPSSFRLLLTDLQALKLTGFEIQREYETAGCEFFVTLGKNHENTKSPPTNRISQLQKIKNEEELGYS